MERNGGGQNAKAGVTLPPRLEHYLPPDLWRKLSAGAQRRGVLLNALARLRSVLYLLSTYLPRHLVQEKMRRPSAGMVRGQILNGSLLFSDVSGFTALSERLAALGPEGAERLTDLMNGYFERMLKILSWSGGILLKFAGDALLVYFPEQENGEQARWAVRAGQRMMRAMADFADVDPLAGATELAGPDVVGLRMKIGIGTGQFLAASVGTAQRMEYVVLGDTVARTMAAEGVAQAGQVIADKTTAACLDAAYQIEPLAGFDIVSCESDLDLGDFEIKAERRRARGAIPWSAKPHAIVAQMEIALRQIEALRPYLAAELVERIVAQARQRQVESEFRPTTVLFTNLVGLEPLLAAWGPEGVRRATNILGDYFRAMQRVIARRGGVVSRIDPYSQGSKMLVLFGAPVAHEDDPQRAVGAALAMNQELARLNRRWRKQYARHLPADLVENEPLLQQRIGITQGDTFAGQAGSATRREYTVMGDDVNLAARLMSAAKPGQILISQRVYDTVADHVSATALPAIRVKGKSRSIPIYEPTGIHDNPLARRLHHRGALVGRQAEMEQAEAVLCRALDGEGGVLTVTGPAGIGKSHLADELASLALRSTPPGGLALRASEAVAQGCQCLFALCRSYHAAAPYAPWISLLHSWTGIGPMDDAATRRDKLHQTLADLGLAAEEYAEPLGNLLGVERVHAVPTSHRSVKRRTGDQAKPALFARLEKKVATAGTVRQETGVNLWQLVRERPSAGDRDTPRSPAGQIWQTLQTRVAAQQQEQLFRAFAELLARLASEKFLLLFFESAQWMDSASRELLTYLQEHFQGLPVLALVVTRSEGEEDATSPGRGQKLALKPLSQEGTKALVAHHLGGAPLPEEVTATIHEKSGGNPLFIEEIVHWMQRSGHRQEAVLRKSTPDSLRDGLQASGTLQELVLSHLDSLPHVQRDVARRASVVGSEFSWGAVQALQSVKGDAGLLDDCLSGLEKAQLILSAGINGEPRYAFRQSLLREVVYRSLSFSRRRELHARLAAYLETRHAGDLAGQAELLAHHYDLGACAVPAARYLILAGSKACRRFAYSQAAGYYARALNALEQLPVEDAVELRAQAHEGQGNIALLSGDLAAAATAYDAARAGLVANGASAVGTELLVKLALVLPAQDRSAKGQAYARQALAGSTGQDRLAATATLAWILWREGSDEAGAQIEQAAVLAARSTDRWAVTVRALLTDLGGDWPLALRAYQATAQPVGAALAACRLGDRHLSQKDVELAVGLYAQAAEIWEQENDAPGLALARYRQAEAHWRQGSVSAARLALLEAHSLLESAEQVSPADRATIQQALALLDDNCTQCWPSWRWQRYDDAFRILILFRP